MSLCLFGVMYPPIAVSSCITIYSAIYFKEISLCYLLSLPEKSSSFDIDNTPANNTNTSTDDNSIPLGMSCKLHLNLQLRGFAAKFSHAIKYLPCISACLAGWIVFDILGEDVGARDAWWAPVVMIVLAVISFLGKYIK